MVSKFNLVFTNEDIIKQIINYTKTPREIIKIYKKADDEADKIIHICLKFYKMNDEQFSYILHVLKDKIDRDIANHNVRKGEIEYNITEEPPIQNVGNGNECFLDNLLCEGDPSYYINIYKQKDIITWIKKNLHYLMVCSPYKFPHYTPLDRQLKNLFDGEPNHYSTEIWKFCIVCKEFVRDYYNEGEEYRTYRCRYVLCKECFWDEVNKKKIIDKIENREINKYNKLKIKKN